MKHSEFTPKLFQVLKEGISRQQLLREISAGLIVGIVALPLAIAFAIASGVSPDRGIITAILAGLIISLLGGSRVQIGGPTGAFVVIVYGIIRQHGIEGLLIATLMAGVLLVLMGLFRLGSLIKYIPQTLITGFTAGIAVLIFSSQIKDFLGLRIPDVPAGFHPEMDRVFRIPEYSESLGGADRTLQYRRGCSGSPGSAEAPWSLRCHSGLHSCCRGFRSACGNHLRTFRPLKPRISCTRGSRL
nr:SulP family inorganic anion transporter [Marispirochaeta sp.]